MEMASENKIRKRDKLGLVEHMLVYQVWVSLRLALFLLCCNS